MPTFAFRCASCALEFEELLNSCYADNPRCPSCGHHTIRLFSPTRFLVFPYHLSEEERYRVRRRMAQAELSKRGRRIAEIADRLNNSPVLVEN
jgi:putative FmdB family regulatory protein